MVQDANQKGDEVRSIPHTYVMWNTLSRRSVERSRVTSTSLNRGAMNMQQVPELSPFIFAYESRAHEQRAEQNEDTVLLDQRQGLAAIFDGMGSRRGADALGQVASQQAAQVVHRG